MAKHEHEDAIKALQDRTVKTILNQHGGERLEGIAHSTAIEDLLHPEFRSTGGDYQFESRSDFARGIADGKYSITNIEDRPHKVEFPAPNVALVTSQRTVEASIDGNSVSHTFNNTAVYTQVDDQWKTLLWSVTC